MKLSQTILPLSLLSKLIFCSSGNQQMNPADNNIYIDLDKFLAFSVLVGMVLKFDEGKISDPIDNSSHKLIFKCRLIRQTYENLYNEIPPEDKINLKQEKRGPALLKILNFLCREEFFRGTPENFSEKFTLKYEQIFSQGNIKLIDTKTGREIIFSTEALGVKKKAYDVIENFSKNIDSYYDKIIDGREKFWDVLFSPELTFEEKCMALEINIYKLDEEILYLSKRNSEKEWMEKVELHHKNKKVPKPEQVPNFEKLLVKEVPKLEEWIKERETTIKTKKIKKKLERKWAAEEKPEKKPSNMTCLLVVLVILILLFGYCYFMLYYA